MTHRLDIEWYENLSWFPPFGNIARLHNLNSYTPRDPKSFQHFFYCVYIVKNCNMDYYIHLFIMSHSQQLTTERTHTCCTLSVQSSPCVFFHVQRERGVILNLKRQIPNKRKGNYWSFHIHSFITTTVPQNTKCRTLAVSFFFLSFAFFF